VGQRHVTLALTYLLLITFLPFATMVIGRYPGFPAAVWLYAAAMTALALVALRMVALSGQGKRDSRIGLMTLIAAAMASVLLSFILPRWAMAAYLINVADQPLQWLLRRRGSA